MAKYLDTSQISSELMQLLKEAKEKIILVTYSLQVNKQIQERLKTKSKIGTLAEISLIFGNTKPKKEELEWMAEIDDLKVWQKNNLHAKCYINENKAIISSMNLYDYSQTTNVEMGILITKNENPEAYNSMMEDINDLKINGDRIKPWLIEDRPSVIENRPNKIVAKSQLSYLQQLKKIKLEEYRKSMSSKFKQKSKSILSDKVILEIVKISNISLIHLKRILKTDKKLNQLGKDILDEMQEINHGIYTIGEIVETRLQDDDFSYDQVKMRDLERNKSLWYDTKEELPEKNQIVAVSLNRGWFNSYYVLEKTDVKEKRESDIDFDFSNTIYCSTKDLSEKCGVSSRDVNSALVANGFMEKKNGDWFSTKKGDVYGAVQKEGQYGKFIVWPVEMLKVLGLD